ncbi:MAG: enoyl-CoA hydratase/isomerase family protein [Pseudomonadota bacterium]|nr:enoyl-CoA hydratase/isomerase family protein [Pseudomonadota bacterium]
MEFVQLEKQGPIASITMNRPQLHNAFNDQMILELTQAFKQVGSDGDCRVVVLQAAGKNFSAGADLNWMKSMATLTRDENRADALQLAELMHVVYSLPKVVIGKVSGASYGGALGLITACDIAIAARGATFCLSEVRIGLAPAVISPYVIEAMGIKNARRYMLTAEVFNADQAQAMNVVNEVVAAEALEEAVMSLAQLIAKNGGQAMARCKQLIQDIGKAPLGEQTKTVTAEVIADLRVSPEGQEGLAAFLEKREPAWRSTDSEGATA